MGAAYGYAAQDLTFKMRAISNALLSRLERRKLKPLIRMLVAYEQNRKDPNKHPEIQKILKTDEGKAVIKAYKAVKHEADIQGKRLSNDGFGLSVMATMFRQAHDETFNRLDTTETIKNAAYNTASYAWFGVKSLLWLAAVVLAPVIIVAGIALVAVAAVAAVGALLGGGDAPLPDLSDISMPDVSFPEFQPGGGDFGGAGATGDFSGVPKPPVIADVPAGTGSGRTPFSRSIILDVLDATANSYYPYDVPPGPDMPEVRRKDWRTKKRKALSSAYRYTSRTLRKATKPFVHATANYG